MEERRKRKAEDQLSPYSRPIEEEAVTSRMPTPDTGPRKKAKARIGSGVAIADTDPLKGILSSVDILKPVANDKISGLNRCFVKAIQGVVNKEANKDLSYLFKQYEKYLEEIYSSEKQL
jgi:hypothetical protein